jgi:hypothetical protein
MGEISKELDQLAAAFDAAIQDPSLREEAMKSIPRSLYKISHLMKELETVLRIRSWMNADLDKKAASR